MKTLKILKQPYDDEKLIFNKTTGRYELTLQAAKGLVDVMPFKNDEILQKRIRDNSRTIYNYIVLHGNSENRAVSNFLINKTENGRQFIYQVLIAQMESDFEHATNSLGRMPTINSQTGQIIDRNQMRDNLLCLNAEQEIDDSVNYFGVNICYMEVYPFQMFQLVQAFDKGN